MSKVTLDAATARAVAAAGPGAELYDPDGKPLGQLYPQEYIEALARRAEQPPPGFPSIKAFYEHVIRNTPREELERAAASTQWISHGEAMRLLGLD